MLMHANQKDMTRHAWLFSHSSHMHTATQVLAYEAAFLSITHAAVFVQKMPLYMCIKHVLYVAVATTMTNHYMMQSWLTVAQILLLLAWRDLYNQPSSSLLSWFQVAGIHGMPYVSYNGSFAADSPKDTG